MDERFESYVKSLHPSFEQLLGMRPVTIETLPRDAPSACRYLFSENDSPAQSGRLRLQARAVDNRAARSSL